MDGVYGTSSASFSKKRRKYLIYSKVFAAAKDISLI